MAWSLGLQLPEPEHVMARHVHIHVHGRTRDAVELPKIVKRPDGSASIEYGQGMGSSSHASAQEAAEVLKTWIGKRLDKLRQESDGLMRIVTKL